MGLKNRYTSNFIILSVILGGCLFYASTHDPLSRYIDLGVIAYIGFSLLSFIHFGFSILLSERKKKMVLFNLSISHILMKLIMIAIVIAMYYKFKNPEHNIFILPFLVVYIGFTIFELTYSISHVKR